MTDIFCWNLVVAEGKKAKWAYVYFANCADTDAQTKWCKSRLDRVGFGSGEDAEPTPCNVDEEDERDCNTTNEILKSGGEDAKKVHDSNNGHSGEGRWRW